MTMLTDNPKLGRRLQAQISMKRAALAYLKSVMTEDPPQSDLLKFDNLTREIARIEDLLG